MHKLTGILVGLGLLLGGCSNDKEAAPAVADQAVMLEAPAVEYAPVSGAAEAEQADALADGNSGPAAVPVSPTARQLIYKADVDIKVRDLPRAAARVDSIVRRSGSWVGAAAQTHSDDAWRQEMTIRVRPERFTTLLAGLSALGTVERKALTSEDVTAEHADVAARLRTKRALEQRYIGLLSQAKKVSEVLEIEGKIGQVREEIESAESRFKALNDQVAYSTITLKLYQPLTLPAPDAPVISFGSRVVEAFYDGWQLVTGLCIGLVALWPLLLVGGVVFWLVRRWRLRRLALQ
ncbi:DUF4349 domain-containing protein [Hymenobacter jeollabukensis]|uniref:DUF4349 domain-containing protein n=1 Tax=Hymenobacter jeollabukensis TaxID=2025313 RepID=A0A5R8WW86_9BACT|nr:DUF4349 domain-containing protein [Hymenobacter jeollabukensis]TLM96768.1 DUF4349 domain-containing protein [Hymenobacter jeollabukensis]